MQRAAIVLVVASVAVAGCTQPTYNAPNRPAATGPTTAALTPATRPASTPSIRGGGSTPAGGLEGGGRPRAQLLCPRHLAGAGRSPVPLPGHAVRPSRGAWPFRLHPTLSDTSAADTAAVDR